jgi:hypothetical protein
MTLIVDITALGPSETGRIAQTPISDILPALIG